VKRRISKSRSRRSAFTVAERIYSRLQLTIRDLKTAKFGTLWNPDIILSNATLPIGNRSAYCAALDREKKQPRSVVRCAVEGSTMYICFEGAARYIPDLITMFKEMYVETPPRFGESGSA